ncbi:hypothetical protein [Actinocatenispora rupis]|nr:hypothetical protein [Actinocatenispora rupis]
MRAANILQANGLAVIAGEQGAGRRTSAIRAMKHHLSVNGSEPSELFYLAQDWDDDEIPDSEILPDPSPGCGYLLDATLRSLPAGHIHSLTAWAERLHSRGSCLLITIRRNDWVGDPNLVVSAESPDAIQVARNHLAFRHGSPDRADWLEPAPQRTRGLFSGGSSPDLAAGSLSDLITRNASPTDAVAIAERIQRVNPDQLRRAVQTAAAREKHSADEIDFALREIRDEIRGWPHFLERVLTESGTRGRDRVMLLAAAYLEGKPLELCIKAANAFSGQKEPGARRVREGRSPRRRMVDVGVDITDDDRAAFDTHPGLAMAAIRMDWHHWADERTATRKWLISITEPGAVAERWAEQIGTRLLELSRTASEDPFMPVIDEWSKLDNVDRTAIVSRLLAQAVNVPRFAAATHKMLLEWAKSSVPSRRAIVGQVCSGSYREIWPHRAFTRLRHLLAYDDESSHNAADTLIVHARASSAGFSHVINTVDAWLDRFPQSPTSARAFLALVDPFHHKAILPSLVKLAETQPQYRDFLIGGWRIALSLPEVTEDAYKTLVDWVNAAHDNRLKQGFIFELLVDVRNAHTPLDAMSRFLYGHPDHEGPALIEARRALTNVRTCNHESCVRADCPVVNRKPEEPSPQPGAVGEEAEPEISTTE